MKAATKFYLKSKCPHRLWKALVSFYYRLMGIRQRILMLFFARKMTYYCPCCKVKLKSFVEGVDYLGRPDFYDVSLFQNVRQDVQCPVCSSLPRHRILASWGEDNSVYLRHKDVLYFAPERGMTRWMDSNGIRYKTADLFDPDVDLKLDIQKTGLPDGSYDVVICNHVLEHVDDYMTALREIRRILRPGGILICSFPISPDINLVDEDKSVVTESERLARYGQSDHVRLFGINSGRLIEDAGFEVTVISGDDYPGEILPVTGPSAYDINRLFLCKVSSV